MSEIEEKLNEIIVDYNQLVRNIDNAAKTRDDRAYGGMIRAFKGELVESIAEKLVKIAWLDVLNQEPIRIEINKKKMPIGISDDYITRISDIEVRNYVKSHRDSLIYKFGTDVQVFIDGKLVLPIECKAYTENAMLKRILFDAKLMKEAVGTNAYYLLQLESQLGGDYSELNEVTYGSPATHALLSSVDVELIIITLLKGERKVDRPIHKIEFYKELKMKELKKAVEIFAKALHKYIK